ncbi:gastrula zinc finger protein XlCGF44.2-like [Daphnia pulicaria]|uniref:gastrula zinc finger protein XlCGF44.2-like n=1 Tax=Daphnia pulicaria TaxID=35523 RepID=UPI001EE9C62A|nr:gastrula zinc finger protein XlCGF44.2-like [Daphnia pulicaria]
MVGKGAGPTSRRYGYRRLNPGYQHVCCNQLFSRIELKAHKEEHHREGFICPTCNKNFEFRLGFLRHKQIHERKYQCEQCGFSTQNKIKLKRHKKIKHPKIHKCDKCSYQTKSDYSIKRHQQKHRKKQSKSWTDWQTEQILKKVMEEKGIPDE